MNPQPDQITTNIFTLFILIGIAYFALNKKYHYTISDEINLGYIRDEEIVASAAVMVEKFSPPPVPPAKPKKTVQRQPKKPAVRKEYNELEQDCYDALKALGMKTKEAKFVVNQTFNNHDPKTIQEFLKIALNRPNDYNRTIS